MPKSFEQIKKEMIRGLRSKRRRTKEPVIIATIGLTGAGNSTLAKTLNKMLGWVVLEKNKIRVKLREEGRGFDPATTDQIHYAMLAKILKGGENAILDSDFAEKGKRKKLERFAKRFKARIAYLHLVCDHDVMLGRMMRSNYNSKTDIFKNAAIAMREHARRIPWHYRWSPVNGGSYFPLKLPIKFFAEINTTDPDKWKKKLRLVAKRLRKM